MDEDAEREYVEAKAAYDAALVRLVAARKARPKRPTRNELRREAHQRFADAVWQVYLAGKRDYAALAEEFGCTRPQVGRAVRENLERRGFGPETRDDYDYRVLVQLMKEEKAASRNAMVEEGLRMAMEPGRSSAWHMAHRAFEEGRLRAAAEEC